MWVAVDVEQYTLSFLPLLENLPTASVKAHYWLGVAHEQQGQKTQAIKEYEQFLGIWKDADFKSAEISDAKTRLAKLKGMATR